MSVKITNGQKKPNKAIMLLSVIDLIRCGYIRDNKIYLEKTIEDAFEYNWRKYIDPNPPICWTPFWHLKQDGFWHFHPLNTLADVENLVPKGQTASIGKMRSAIEYAYLDVDLFEMLQDSFYRNKISEILFDVYVNRPEPSSIYKQK